VAVSGDFNNTADYISMTTGGAGAVSTGAYTIVVLAKPAALNVGFASTLNAGSTQRQLVLDTGALFGQNDFVGFGSLTANLWYVIAQSKAAGSAGYRHHYWAYDSGLTGSFTHQSAPGSGSHGDFGSAATELRIGTTANNARGPIAVVGYWTRELTDGQLDTLISTSLSSWKNIGGGQPAALVSLQNWNGTTGATDVAGTSTFSSLTGTVNVGADPPGFDYSLTGGNTLPAPVLVVPSSAAVRASTW
jgi:hypothetical protein